MGEKPRDTNVQDVSKMSNREILAWAKQRAIEKQKRDLESKGRIARM